MLSSQVPSAAESNASSSSSHDLFIEQCLWPWRSKKGEIQSSKFASPFKNNSHQNPGNTMNDPYEKTPTVPHPPSNPILNMFMRENCQRSWDALLKKFGLARPPWLLARPLSRLASWMRSEWKPKISSSIVRDVSIIVDEIEVRFHLYIFPVMDFGLRIGYPREKIHLHHKSS